MVDSEEVHRFLRNRQMYGFRTLESAQKCSFIRWQYIIPHCNQTSNRRTRRGKLNSGTAPPTTLGLGKVPLLSTISTSGPSAISNTKFRTRTNSTALQETT